MLSYDLIPRPKLVTGQKTAMVAEGISRAVRNKKPVYHGPGTPCIHVRNIICTLGPVLYLAMAGPSTSKVVHNTSLVA